jgi:hypothetical protein
VPLVNSTKLTIVSEKIVRSGYKTTPLSDEEVQDLGEEKLVVRWKTSPQPSSPSSTSASAPFTSSAPPTPSPSSAPKGTNASLSTLLGGDRPLFSSSSGRKDEFTGLFIFTFTDKGLIATHTIEHADENNGWDKTSKVVTVADWLLGKAKRMNGKKEEEPGLIPGLVAEGLGRGEIRTGQWEGMRR